MLQVSASATTKSFRKLQFILSTTVMKLLLKLYARKHENFLIYVHPFELTACDLPLPKELGAATKFRCLIGRKGNLKKLTKIIRSLKKMGARFTTLEEDRKERGLS